jgi:hypothetical protein
MADPWPVNERSVLYQELSALVSRALAESMKVFVQVFSDVMTGVWAEPVSR